MADTLIIWVLCDDKPGHENQALGLAAALGRIMSCEVRRIGVGGMGGLERLASLRKIQDVDAPPDLIMGAGHATHWGLLMLARKYRARSVVLMKPSLPLGWFDLCVAPEHDFGVGPVRKNVITTRGAINRVRCEKSRRGQGGLVLVGGPSATHDWDSGEVLERLRRIVDGASPGKWRLTTSRRTPLEMEGLLREALPRVKVFSHEETDREWLPSQLARAAEVWVTEDSVSMVYEALSSGARVGLLPVPRKAGDSRVLRGLADLVELGFVTSYDDWTRLGRLAAPPHVLREADRCAELLLERLFG